ncbi:hypothetical protein ACFSUM_18375 [Virgibacillus siamensis]|uniref:hypothetical protein n=2 Tax=Bacillati TaxID=1783272 RepID=UPI00362DBB45
MTESLIYITLSIFDCLAYIFLILTLYMLPVWNYRYRILSFALFIAVFSYTMRIVLELPKFDLALQYIFLVVFLRFCMKIKTHIAAFIGGAGLTCYITLQMFFYYSFNLMGAVPQNAIEYNTGYSVYAIQVSSIAMAYIIATLLFITRKGFTFIIAPPHDFLIREDYSTTTNKLMILGSIFSIVTVALTLTLLYTSNFIWLVSMCVVTMLCSLYFSLRSDQADVRKNLESYRKRNM